MLFASLSRQFSMNELDLTKYSEFKQRFMKKLATESELNVQDVLALVVPLAAEEMDQEPVWDKFANVVVSNEHKMMSN